MFKLLIILLPSLCLASISNESELGVNLVSGNTRQSIYNLKTLNTVPLNSDDTLKFGGHYSYGSAKRVRQAENWDLNARVERLMLPDLSLYVSQILLGDNFGGFDWRSISEIGETYKIVNNETSILIGELGLAYAHEEATKKLNYILGRVSANYTHIFGPRASANIDIDYFPNFVVSKDYFLNTQLSTSTHLTDIFSTKISVQGKLRGEPPNKKLRYDQIVMASIVAKF